MKDIEAEAKHELALAERAVEVQRARLSALQDPVTAIAAQLHAVLGCRWCSDPLHFEPGYQAPSQLDGWAISQQHVNRMYLSAASRIEAATRGRLPPGEIGAVFRAIADALREGDAERFRR